MSFTPEEKEEIYRNTNTIHKDGDFLIVEPLSRDSIEYYGGSKIMIDYYGRVYRNGIIYLIINTQTSPVEVLSVFIPEESGKLEFIDIDGESFLTKEGFFKRIPNNLLEKVEDLIVQNTTYGRLLRISEGEKLDFVDELITNISYNESNSKKTIIRISFEDEQEYFKTIGITEDDLNIFNTLFGNYYYNNSLNLYDSYRASDDFSEGYLFGHFSDENMGKLNEIIKYISPKNYNFQPEHEWGEIVGEKLLDLFNESQNIIDTFVDMQNDCIDETIKSDLTNDLCDIYSIYGIFVQNCFLKYYSSIKLILSAYDKVGDRTLTIGELMKKIAESSVEDDYYEMILETYCDKNFDEEFNKEVSNQLDNMLEHIEDSDDFLDIKEFNVLYDQVISKYGINKYNVVPKDKNKKFKILTIDPSKNKIAIEVVNRDSNEFEKRELDIEEFNNFLYTGELF
jgi:hypothetical protein